MNNVERQSDGFCPEVSCNELSVRGAESLVKMLGLVALCVLALRIAWISDDSLITLRTALNLAHGWGPGFNAAEAVQAYTHPLWFLIWLLVGTVTNEWILSIIIVSLICSVAAVSIVLWNIHSIAAVILVVSAFVFSNAFMEYSTSGLENPLAYLLIGATFVFSSKVNYQLDDSPEMAFPLGACIAFGAILSAVMLTRLDLMLLVFPAVALFMWRVRWQSVAVIAIGFLVPIMAWFTWSYMTYSALLPNTFSAKLNVEIPLAEKLVQGSRYLWVSLEYDPITPLILFVGFAVSFLWGKALHRAWAAGIAAYLVYVLYIAGDFMAGRFLAVPFYTAVILVATNPQWSQLRGRAIAELRGLILTFTFLASTLLALIVAERQPVSLLNPKDQRWHYENAAGVADERGFYVANTGGIIDLIMSLGKPSEIPPFRQLTDQINYADIADIWAASRNWPIRREGRHDLPIGVEVKCGLLGAAGLVTGPAVHWIDTCGLADRFLATETYEAAGLRWRVGHYRRRLPDGYVEAIANNNPSLLADPNRAKQLEELWTLIRSH